MIHGTTILAVRHGGRTAMACDGQATHGDTIMKSNVKKIKTFLDGQVLVGFAGSVADAVTLLEFFEKKINSTKDLKRASVALAREWRTNKIYGRLEADLLLADKNTILLLSGNGDVIEAEGESLAIGSGGMYALAASKAFMQTVPEEVNASLIARKSLEIASEICIYTNNNIIVEEVRG